jgi:thiol-disulfide isomerase/thioredoxin
VIILADGMWPAVVFFGLHTGFYKILVMKKSVFGLMSAFIVSFWMFFACGDAKRYPNGDTELIVFLAPDCPVSLYYIPDLRNIHQEWSHRIKMKGVIPGTTASMEECQHFKGLYSLPFEVLHDSEMEYVKRWGAEVTPEVVLVDGGGNILYRGAIDDVQPELGIRRSVVHRRYLLETLIALDAKRPLPYTQIPAVGCFIESE